MSILKNYQKEQLKTGTEQINYKVYSSQGTYKTNENKNVLFSTPRQLIPLRNSFMKSFEKPIKKVVLPIKINKINIKNENPNFTAIKFISARGWAFVLNGGNVARDLDSDVKALSGNKYLKATNLFNDPSTTYFTNSEPDSCIIKSKAEIEFAYSYYIKTSGSSAKYNWRVQIQAIDSSSANHYYNFETNEWQSTTTEIIRTTETINKWGKLVFNMNPLIIANNDDDIEIRVFIFLPEQISDSGTYDSSYIDNAYIAELNRTDSSDYIIERKIPDGDKTITGEIIMEKQILSNDLNDSDYFNGKISGTFRRPRDTADKKLEQIITQEILNDNREFTSRYEGTFYNNAFDHISMHNKIYLDFGSDIFQETVSSYIDSMTHYMKSNEYKLQLHTPNQNNDVSSIYQSKFK